MKIEEMARKFHEGKNFQRGTTDYVVIDRAGCRRWVNAGTTVAVQRPEDKAIAMPPHGWSMEIERRQQALKKLMGI